MNLNLSYLYQVWGEAVALWLRAAPQREICLTAHGWLAASGEPYVDLNQVLIDASRDAEEQLRTFHQRLEARNLPALYLFTPTVADQLAPIASKLGMTIAGKAPVMVCAASDLPDTDAGLYTFKQVDTAAEQKIICAILANAFEVSDAALRQVVNTTQLDAPGFTAYLAYQGATAGEQPVSTVATTESGPLVGVWAMATLPTHQRQGSGRALLGAVMAQHRSHGAKHFYLWSTAAGQRLYEQLGYRTVTELSIWTTGQSVQSHA